MMTRTLRTLASAVTLVVVLVLGGTASAEFAPDAGSLVGSWFVDYPAMLAEMTPEEQAAADANMTDKTVDMVFNADNTGVRTETLSGETTVSSGTWSVTDINGNVVTVSITDEGGTTENVWTFADENTINWTVEGLPCNVIMRRQQP